VHQRQGNAQKAQQYFNKVREITPNNANLQQKEQVIEEPSAPTQPETNQETETQTQPQPNN